MKKLLVMALVCLGIFSGVQFSFMTAEAAHIAAYADVTVINVSEYVNLREEPSTKSAILAKIPRGATVQVHAEYIQHNGFYSVIYQGIHGYIHKNYLDVPTWAR